jgi:2-haloacid dehalogenase
VTHRYRWLLFDADDTLFDFAAAEARALEEAFRLAGMECEPGWLAVYRDVNGRAWRALEAGHVTAARLRVMRFEDLFADLGLGLDPVAFSGAYLRCLGQQTQLVDGALDVVRALAPSHRIAVITNGLAEVQRPRLRRSAIAPWVEHLVISEEVGAAKPDPAIFAAAFERLGGPAHDEVLMIGDSLSSDIAGGAAFAIDTCWFNPLAKPAGDGPVPTFEIRRLAELPGIVGAPQP